MIDLITFVIVCKKGIRYGSCMVFGCLLSPQQPPKNKARQIKPNLTKHSPNPAKTEPTKPTETVHNRHIVFSWRHQNIVTLWRRYSLPRRFTLKKKRIISNCFLGFTMVIAPKTHRLYAILEKTSEMDYQPVNEFKPTSSFHNYLLLKREFLHGVTRKQSLLRPNVFHRAQSITQK